MRFGFFIAIVAAGFAAAHAADPREVWEQAVAAKGGRERLHAIHSLAIYMKPAEVNLRGAPTNWLCVFPDRYFEYQGLPGGNARAIVVDGTAGRTAMDTTGIPRQARHLTSSEGEQMTVNQIVFLLESAWLQPQPIEVRHNVLVVEAAGRTYKIFLDKENLPERIMSSAMHGRNADVHYDYRLQHYRKYEGVMLPTRVVLVAGIRQSTWDVDYEVEAKYNPKLFERIPDLANGPEPWRMR
jgi:hypothetical protein